MFSFVCTEERPRDVGDNTLGIVAFPYTRTSAVSPSQVSVAVRLALLVARFCFVPTSLGSLGIRRTTGFGRVSWHARHVNWPVPRTRGERPCPNWRLLCYTFVRAQNCRQICGLCAQTPSSPSPPWSPFSSPSARSPLCSLRGCSSTFEVSICLACAFAACHIVTSCTPHLRARPCQLSDGAFADAPVLTARRLPLFAIVFLYQLSAADAAPTDSTDPGDAFIGAAAAVGTLATAAAKRLSSAGPASTCGKNSAGSKPLSLCVLFHLAQLCSRGTATPQVTRRPRPSGRSPPQSPASRPVTLRSKSSHVHVDRPRLPPLLRGSSTRQMRLGRLRRSPYPTKPCSACLPPWPSSRCTGSASSLTP